MDERQIADYFVVAGLPESEADRVEEDPVGSHLKHSNDLDPVTDLAVIFPASDESVPPGFTVIDTTPTGLLADLNHGSLRSPEVFLCFKRGRDKPPLVDIGIMYDGKERILPDSEILLTTPYGRSANVNNSSAKTFVTYRRAQPTMPCNALVVMDICVIITSKGETPPHAFCIINKNLNKGMVGSDVFLCYKKSMNKAPSITYKPAVISKYPISDRKHFPLPPSVPLFCLPMGATLEAWPVEAQQPPPVFSTFVLTMSDAVQKVYGSAVSFYEDYPYDLVTEKQKLRLCLNSDNYHFRSSATDDDEVGKSSLISYHVVKSVCLLSHWPFFDAFEKFLLFLYNMSREGSHSIPIERYILHFMENVPFPSVQRPRILVQLSTVDRLILTQPEDLPLPRSGAGFHQMLMNLGPDNCLLLLLCVLTEQKILIHSLRPDVLTAVAEAVSMIIFPFKWQCPYIPLCPLSLAEVLHAPVPFLIGVDSRFFDLYDPPADVNCVDLDTNNIALCEEKKYLTTKLLPKKAVRALKSNLEVTYQKLATFLQTLQTYNNNKDMNIDKDFLLKRKELSLELEIQEAFLKFMVHTLKGYRNYLLPIIKAPTVGATDTNSLFDLQNFLRSRDRSYQKFYSLVTRTQMFIRFIEERSFVSDLDAGLAFFDECIEKVEQEEVEVHLLELDESQQSERTVFVSPPEQSTMNDFSYQNGFSLNPTFFYQKKIKNNFLDIGGGISAVPGSPLARRTKYEVKSAQKLARKHYSSSELWVKCLLTTCYSLWFIHLPSYVLYSEQKVATTLRLAYDLLARIQKTGLQLTDEVCYRVMMQLCGVYSQPMLAVKLLFLMKRSGIQPNAITYGFYNRALLESKWPTDMNNSSELLWNKLRNVVHATAFLRKMGLEAKRRKSLPHVGEISLLDGVSTLKENVPVFNTNAISCVSGHPNDVEDDDDDDNNDIIRENDLKKLAFGSDVTETVSTANSITPIIMRTLENDSCERDESKILLPENQYAAMPRLGQRRSSAITSRDIATFNKFCSKMGSIVKTTGLPIRNQSPSVNQQHYESSAGLLMTGGVSIPHFLGNDVNLSHLENEKDGFTSPPYSSCNVRNRRIRSDSFSETVTSSSPKSNARPYHAYYSGTSNNAKTSSYEASDCYQLLTRSESFANDAQILKNLQEMKMQKYYDYDSMDVYAAPLSTESTPPFKSRITANSINRTPARKSGLQKVKEHPCSESRASSAETLLCCEIGHVDNSMLNCQQFSKRPVSDEVLVSLEAEFNNTCDIAATDKPRRKISVCSLEELNAREENESLNRVSSTPSLKSPIRTPVTENDPLGALRLKQARDLAKEDIQKLKVFEPTVPGNVSSKIELDQAGIPVLFHRRKGNWDTVTDEVDPHRRHSKDSTVSKSSTLSGDDKGENCSGDTVGSPFKTSFGSLSSNFKLPFSPSSLTSKKSNEILMGGLSSLKNAASSMAKKIDEIKEAISANATPLKDGIFEGQYFDDDGNDSYSVHNGVSHSTGGTGGGDEETIRRKISNEFSPSSVTQQLDSWSANVREFFSDGSRKGSTSNLQPLGEHTPSSSQQSLAFINLYPKRNRDPCIPVAIELIMTTCSKCHHCCSLIYDEEIMAGWLPEDSNLNTKCPFCDKATVPFLYVSVFDYRTKNEVLTQFISQESVASSFEKVKRKNSFNRSNTSSDSVGGSRVSVDSSTTDDEANAKFRNVHTLEPIIVPYLNPLVLRKELESILNTEGDVCLTRSSFVDEHPIIYWNLVWTFERIQACSHVPGLCLQARSIIGNRDVSLFHSSWSECDHRNVFIRTLWDNPKLHEEVGYPMYVLWNKNDKESDLLSALLTNNTTIPKSLMDRVIVSIQCSDLSDPIRRVAAERAKLKSHGINHNYSLYRDILFLAFVAIGRENIDLNSFDREYMESLEKLTPAERESKIYLQCDNPNLNRSIYFRHYFRELDLL